MSDLPCGWTRAHIAEVAEINPGPSRAVADEEEVSFLAMADVSEDGRVVTQQQRKFSAVRNGFTYFENDDVLVAKITPCFENGKGALVRDLLNGIGCGSTEFHVLRAKDCIEPGFLFLITRTESFRASGEKHMVGSAGQKRVPTEFIRSYHLSVPTKPEQRRLVGIIGAWDSAINDLTKLREAKVERSRGLMEQLLTGKKRLGEFCGEGWRKLALGGILNFEPRVITKPKGTFLAAGIRSHGKGVFLKPDFEAGDIALDELFQLRTNDLVLNITFAWEGAVAIVPPGADGALVSHRFPTFTFKRGMSFPGYFRHLIRQKRFVHELGLVSPGGAGRNRVLSKSDFLRIRVELPSFDEQQRIAAVLDTSDREIELLQKQLYALKEQKRGLMQKLLTGEIRVKAEGRKQKAESGVQNRREEA